MAGDRRGRRNRRGAHRKIAQRLVEGERALTELMSRLDQVRGEHEQHRAAQLEQMRAVGVLGNEISGLENQVASTSAARDRSRSRMADLDRQSPPSLWNSMVSAASAMNSRRCPIARRTSPGGGAAACPGAARAGHPQR